jgi:flavorubredoxin
MLLFLICEVRLGANVEISVNNLFSCTENTQKVAFAITEGLEKEGVAVDLKKPQEAANVDFFYDLVCVGSPPIEWQPAKPMSDLQEKLARKPLALAIWMNCEITFLG